MKNFCHRLCRKRISSCRKKYKYDSSSKKLRLCFIGVLSGVERIKSWWTKWLLVLIWGHQPSFRTVHFTQTTYFRSYAFQCLEMVSMMALGQGLRQKNWWWWWWWSPFCTSPRQGWWWCCQAVRQQGKQRNSQSQVEASILDSPEGVWSFECLKVWTS